MRLSLNFQILAGVLLTSLTFIGIMTSLGIHFLVGYLREDALESLGRTATFLSQRLEAGLRARGAELSLVADRINETSLADLELGKREITRLQELVPQFSWIGLVDLDGNIVAATDDSYVGRNIKASRVYIETIQKHVIGDRHHALLHDHLALADADVAHHFLEVSIHLTGQDGRIVGLILANLNSRWALSILESALPNDLVAQGIELVTINRDHEVILASNLALKGTLIPPALKSMQSGSREILVEDWEKQGGFLVSMADTDQHPILTDLGWTVFCRQPTSVAMSRIDDFAWKSLGWGSSVISLCLLLALYLSHRIVSPIARLTHSANQVSSGHHQSIVSISGSSEMISLAKSIDTLLNARKKLEERLVEQSELLRAILNAAVDSIITIDDSGKIIAVNRSCERAFGYSEAELIGRNVSMLMPSPHRDVHDQYISRYLSTGNAKIIGTGREVPARRHDGSIFPAELSIGEVQLAGRRLFTGIIRDLTNNFLLRQARDTAEAASRAKSRFLSAASHDLRQPVHALGLLASALGRQQVNDESRDLIVHIQSVVKSMQGMFDSLLDIARIEAGTYSAEIVDVNIGRLLKSLADEMSADAAEKNVSLKVVKSSVVVRADPILLDRILRNLLSNAIKFARGGRVVAGVRHGRRSARIVIADSGIGIASDQLRHIFEEFRQLPDGKAAGGLGLGLAIARSLALLMKSDLSVHSVLGKGSAFWLDLPIASAASLQRTVRVDTGAVEEINLAGLQVLVADDDQNVLTAMQAVFVAAGAKTKLARNAIELEQRLSEPVDLAVLDLQLEESGTVIGLLNRIKAQGKTLPPTVIITGATDSSAVNALQKSGIPWLTKPIDADSLFAVLRRLNLQR